MWGLGIYCGVLRKPMLARGIDYYHWSSYSLCPAQRHKWLTWNPNSLTLNPQQPMTAIFGQRLLQYGKASAKKMVVIKPKAKDEKTPTDRKMKPKFEEMSKGKITKSKMKSRVDEKPKEKITIKPKYGEPPRQKNINSKMKTKVEETVKENIGKSKIMPKALKEKNEKIKIKAKVEATSKEKNRNSMIKHKVEQYGKAATKKTIEKKPMPKDEKNPTERKTKPKIEEMSKKKITKSKMKSSVGETPKEKITESKIKSKDGETPRQENINNKMKLKVEETRKENIGKIKIMPKALKEKIEIKSTVEEASKENIEKNMIKHKVEHVSNGKIMESKMKPKIAETSMEKSAHSMTKPRIEKPSKKKNMASKIEIESKVKKTPKEKITDSKMKPKVEETPKGKITKSKINSKALQYPMKKNTKSKLKPAVRQISKEKTTASAVKFKVGETPKVKIKKKKVKPKVEVIPNKKIAMSNIKPQVEIIPNKKIAKGNIKPQVEVIPNKKIVKSNMKPQVEVISNKKIAKGNIKSQVEVIINKKNAKGNIKPQVEVIPNKKNAKGNIKHQVEVIQNKKIAKSNIKTQVEVTPKRKIKAQIVVIPKKKIITTNRKINRRRKKPKVQETLKEKSTKRKIKFKVEETPKDNAAMNVHQEVRQVLQDYLYYTRGLPFADANHISLNAPSFVQKLSSIFHPQRHECIPSAVQKYLLFNPINEFEPFFESIGIQPCDIHGLLPQHCLYLGENETLLATISTLTNFGFPRDQLGKIYVERPQLFSSSSGELQKKLQFYENIGVSKASLVSVLTWCPTVLDNDVYKQFVKVANGLNGFHLEKNRICCLTEQNRDIQSSILEKIMLLVGIGCPWDEISKLYHTKREIFINSSEQAFYYIIEMFSSLGLRREDIGSFVLQRPEILQSIGLDKKETLERILHHVHDLHGYQGNKFLEGADRTVREKEFSIPSRENHKRTKLEGAVGDKASPEKFQIKLLEVEDLNHRKNAPVLGGGFEGKQSAPPKEIQINENLVKPISRHRLTFLLKVGLAKSPEKIAKVGSRLTVAGDELQKRVNYLLGLGFPFHVVCKMVISRPEILCRTLQLTRKKVDFLSSSSSNSIEELEFFPRYLCYDLERRIMPRCKMYDWLKANNVLEGDFRLETIIGVSERIFLERYVKLHPQGRQYFMQCKLEHL